MLSAQMKASSGLTLNDERCHQSALFGEIPEHPMRVIALVYPRVSSEHFQCSISDKPSDIRKNVKRFAPDIVRIFSDWGKSRTNPTDGNCFA